MSEEATQEGIITLEVIDGTVALVRIERAAKLNALTAEMTRQLYDHVSAINDEQALRVVVLTGSGRAFCVGSDINELAKYPSPWAFGRRRDYGDVIRSLKKPCIASINGYAYGGGLELALACDIRIAAATASFAAPEIKLGWVGGSGQCALLAHSIGPSNADYMVLTGEPVDATTALSWGLISRVVPDDALSDVTVALASAIALLPPIAMETAKIDLWAAYSLPLRDAITLERHLQTICFATEDAAEGRRAFADKRAASFEGR